MYSGVAVSWGMVREGGFVILPKASRGFTGVTGVQRMPGWALGELVKKRSFRFLGKIPFSLISK